MKILIINGYPLKDMVSGSLAHVWNLARFIAAMDGMEVHVIALGDKRRQFKDGDVNVCVINKKWFYFPFLFLLTWPSIKRMINRINPDVVHAMREYPHTTLAFLLRRKYPTLLTVFSLSEREIHFEKNLISILKRVLFIIPNERYVIPRIPHIIVQTRFMAELVGRMTKSKMHIVPEGIDYQRLQQFQPSRLSGDPSDIFVAVSFRKLKGIDMLINAIPIVVKSVPDLKVSIAGSGEEEANLNRLAKELGVAGHVKFLGFISDEAEKNGYYGNCKIVVVPSRWDNEPNAPMDGAVFGKPAIVSESANSSVVIDGQTGFVFETENVGELAAKIVTLLTDDKLREDMGKAIREKVKEYDWPRIAGSTASIYHEVIVDFRSRGTQNR